MRRHNQIIIHSKIFRYFIHIHPKGVFLVHTVSLSPFSFIKCQNTNINWPNLSLHTSALFGFLFLAHLAITISDIVKSHYLTVSEIYLKMYFSTKCKSGCLLWLPFCIVFLFHPRVTMTALMSVGWICMKSDRLTLRLFTCSFNPYIYAHLKNQHILVYTFFFINIK